MEHAAGGRPARYPVGWLLGAAVVVAAPLAGLAALVFAPDLDARWESHPAHFWLVLGAALASVSLGYALSVAGRRRRDARLFLVSCAFMSCSGFLGLHALATPDVLVGKNAGFELATPVGVVLGGVFASASALELGARRAGRLMRHARLLVGLLIGAFVVWGAVSIAETWPLDAPLAAEQLDGWQIALAGVGVALYGVTAAGYVRLYLRRRVRFVFAVALAFALLAESMVVVAAARNWQLSWWEWHVLLVFAFGVIAAAARSEWHEERFSALYLDETLAGAKEVSVLFADLAGFTSFAERHSPAEVAAMLNAYFERIVPRMEALGGEVHQLVGDEVMVVFNKQGDRPDHALLAARAALVLQDLAAGVRGERADWPEFRAGVNSGEVLAGVLGGPRGHRKHGVVGDTVNLAARLQGEAPVGRVVIGAETARMLPPGAVIERLPDVRVKGKATPVEAYVLHALPDGSPV